MHENQYGGGPGGWWYAKRGKELSLVFNTILPGPVGIREFMGGEQEGGVYSVLQV